MVVCFATNVVDGVSTSDGAGFDTNLRIQVEGSDFKGGPARAHFFESQRLDFKHLKEGNLCDLTNIP